jgi:hypothetical protein
MDSFRSYDITNIVNYVAKEVKLDDFQVAV